MITKVLLTSIIDNTAPGPDDEQARMILATTAGDILSLGIVVDLEQTDQAPEEAFFQAGHQAGVEAQYGLERAAGHYDQDQVNDNLRAERDEALERAEMWHEQIGTDTNIIMGLRADLEATIELGARAAKLVADMLQQAGRYLTHGYGEINEVLYEARQRGWLEPIE